MPHRTETNGAARHAPAVPEPQGWPFVAALVLTVLAVLPAVLLLPADRGRPVAFAFAVVLLGIVAVDRWAHLPGHRAAAVGIGAGAALAMATAGLPSLGAFFVPALLVWAVTAYRGGRAVGWASTAGGVAMGFAIVGFALTA